MYLDRCWRHARPAWHRATPGRCWYGVQHVCHWQPALPGLFWRHDLRPFLRTSDWYQNHMPTAPLPPRHHWIPACCPCHTLSGGEPGRDMRWRWGRADMSRVVWRCSDFLVRLHIVHYCESCSLSYWPPWPAQVVPYFPPLAPVPLTRFHIPPLHQPFVCIPCWTYPWMCHLTNTSSSFGLHHQVCTSDGPAAYLVEATSVRC